MNTFSLVRSFTQADVKNIHRDAMLRWMVGLPFLVAMALRGVIPLLLPQLETFLPFSLIPHANPLFSVVLLLFVPFLYGMVIGFLLLDQRDDGTLMALQVTPLSLNGYLAYRLLLPMGLSVVVTTAVFPVANLPVPSLPGLVITAIAAAPLTAVFALLLSTFAQNKVQGFVIAKLSGVFMLPPLAAYFAPPPWRWLLGFAPTFWPAQLFWHIQSADAWFYALIALFYHFLLITLLLRRLNRVLHQE